MSEEIHAVDHLLAGIIDYAGLYPPAALDMRSAINNYLEYSRGKHSTVLGRFVVDLDRLPELCAVAADSIRNLRLSIIASPDANWLSPQHLLDEGLVESVEVRSDPSSDIGRIVKLIPAGIITYIALPISARPETLDAIAAGDARVKLRTGGVVAEAFPSSEAIADMLKALADRCIPFKATAGLHHPIRSQHSFTYAPDSPTGTMHGFLNVFLAAALLYLGGPLDEAKQLLNEECPEAFSLSMHAITWRSFHWSAAQIGTVRKEFAIGFGSCSFEEPIHGLEALGWLA